MNTKKSAISRIENHAEDIKLSTSVVGEWRTRPAMEKHFKTQDFDILIGAARVLGETFEMNIADVLKTGDFELAEQMASQKRGNAVAD